MKRTELSVGMTVEKKNGARLKVVSADGWKNANGWADRPTGVTFEGHPIVAVAVRPGPGVLVIHERTLAQANPGQQLCADVVQPRLLFPEGTRAAADAVIEAQVDADEKRDRELIEMAQHYWGDIPHLIATCGVDLDGGLLIERERQVLITMVLCGQNR
jgi:hypothetical protein